ncbi:TRAP transporter large permease [Falsiroseomonas oryzae]|uniref:TRAP transporter large permease n=1 Tax=Falsiroseomonas oryzae TaxID=2766473 RepID=UPI0022EAEF3A|nr:TRAP transporter large permease [Roseomonas sp. MO-31]
MSTGLWVLVVAFAGLVLLRAPVAHAMFAAGIAYLLATRQDVGLLVDQVLTSMLTMYVLLAIPMFILAANLMNAATVSERLFGAANALVGRLRGGLGHVTILVTAAFSSMSGSAVSDAAGPGLVSVRMMRQVGAYPRGFAAAVAASAATTGPIIPPSIALVIYALLSNTSVGALFLGGLVPGLLMVVAMMAVVAIQARRMRLPPGEAMGLRLVLHHLGRAVVPLSLPVLLLGGIWGGVFTPTEAAAVAGFYALLLGIFVYRTIGPRSFARVVEESMVQSASVMLLVAGAFIVNYAVTNEQVATRFALMFAALDLDRTEFMLLVMVAFLILGCFLDIAVMLLVFVPVLLPTATALGVDLVHFGVVITVNFMIGMITPPYGVLLFVMSSLTGTPLQEIVAAVWPFVLALTITLLLLALVPGTVTWLPRTFGFT